jgi:Mg-chelatase subunit ChlI
VLADGSVDFAPGLLHQAHNGVLYVDEINLLADHLVDLLLDVSASGINTVERDGISHQHPAEFVLVGTMNPEEGELRPQLLDRYGMCVEVSDSYSVRERVLIVRARMAYDADPQSFNQSASLQQSQLVQRCSTARQRLSTVSLSEKLEMEIAERCVRESAEGVRADIVIYRAARAHAALAGRGEVVVDDIDAVAEFALMHRRRDSDPAAPQSSASHSQPQTPDEPGQSEPGDWGAMPPVEIGTGERRRLDSENDSIAALAKKKIR